MYRRPSKKQQLIRRSFMLVLMVVSVLVIVTGITLFILGYRLDSINGRLQQGALVQINSLPTGGSISIDGRLIGQDTPAKRSLLSGAHSFTVERDGYRPWTKSLNLEAGTLTWLDYIRLIPVNLEREVVATYPKAADMKAAPDRRTLLLQADRSQPRFELIDISSSDITRETLTLPSSVYSPAPRGETPRFTLRAWDAGSRFSLLQYTAGNVEEWIVVDTERVASSVNITRLLSIELSDVQFSGTSGSILYGLTDGVVRKLDLSNETISRALVSNVDEFDMYQANVLTYVGEDNTQQKLKVAGLYRDGDAEPRVLASAPTSSNIQITTARHYNDDYVAIATDAEVTVLKGRYPSSPVDTTSLQPFADFTAPRSVDRLSFSPEGDYLLVEAGNAFMSFEVEYERMTSASLTTNDEQVQPLRWLDKAYVWTVYDGSLSIREFDGTNGNIITPAVGGFDATLSQNGRYLYAVTIGEDEQYRLERTILVLEN